MPFKIIRSDITKMETDAIVNTANPLPIVGDGSDANVYKAAGVEQLLKARTELGKIERGEAVFTEGFNLPAKYIIHTVGPNWKGGSFGEENQLRNCYRNSLEIAYELGCKSVAFPLISAGSYGYPKEKALNVALDEINHFLINTDFSDDEELSDMEVYLVIYDEEVYTLTSKIYADIQSYIDENYIEANEKNESLYYGENLQKLELKQKENAAESSVRITEKKLSLEEALNLKQDAFQDLLMHHIAVRNLSNKSVYKRANIDAKLFSKIICNKNYVPKKKNVMALAIGLKLNLEEAEDFLKAAGFAFSQSEKMDIIVKYFISNQNYNMFELEEKLWTITGETLGNLIE